MRSILSVFDDNGNEIPIPALKGQSAYEIAVRNGFEGTEAEWLASLNGESYILTDADKTEIAEKVPFVTTPTAPLYADGVSGMNDVTKMYVNTETGTFWRYQETTYEGTLTDVIDLYDSDNPAHDGYKLNKSGELEAKTNSFVTPYINLSEYSGQIALKIKGATTCISASATGDICASLSDENRAHLQRTYMTLAQQQINNYIVPTLCETVDKVSVDGDTTTLIMDLPRKMQSNAIIHNVRFSLAGTVAAVEISVDYRSMRTEKMWVDTGIAYAPAVTEADKVAIAQQVAAMVDANLISIIGDGEVVV